MSKPKSTSKAATAQPKASAPRPRRVGLVSLGCAKNLVDAEIMLGSLLKSGVEIVNDASEADAVIVNTCSFIDAAQEESVDTILEQTRCARPPTAVRRSSSPAACPSGSGTSCPS